MTNGRFRDDPADRAAPPVRSTAAEATELISAWLTEHSRWVLTAASSLTALLVVPMVLMAPSETASQSPTNAVTRAQDQISVHFASPVHAVLLVVEATDGDILSPQSLLAVLQRTDALKVDPEVAPFLTSRFIAELNANSAGVFTIADAVDQVLRQRGSALAGADPAEVSNVIANLIEQTGTRPWGLAHQAARDPSGRWSAPALIVTVEADNAALGGGGNFVAIGAQDLTKEEFSRDVLEVFRAETIAIATWTVATDVNLTSIEQGTRAGPFIGLTVFVVLVILLVVFRSYWLVAVSALALGAVMIWLKGLANLVGLENDQLLAIIVPIGMISFGIDSTFHVYGRHREEAGSAGSPKRAFRVGTAAVLSPVALALASDSAAFLSNLTSPIESVRQFGIAAALAAAAAFLLLGICTPLAVAEIEERVGTGPWSQWGAIGDLTLGAAAAGMATVAVLLIVFVSPVAGTILLVVYGLLAIGLPLLSAVGKGDGPSEAESLPSADRLAGLVERVAGSFGGHPLVTIFSFAALTGFVLFHALQVRPSFEVTDFFSPDVDFVVGIDKVNLYGGTQAGEPATILVETDFSQPSALAATARFVDELRELDTELLANDNGSVLVGGGVIDLVRDAMNPRYQIPGSTITWRADNDRNGLPDTTAEIEVLLAAVKANGILNADAQPLWTPGTIATVIGRIDDAILATPIGVEVPDTSNQESVTAVRDLIEPRTAALADELEETEPASAVTFTGSPVFRDEQLAAIVRSLLLSLPVAVLLCVLLVAGFTGSFRLAVLSIVPVLLVVVWLYGFMAIAGFGINVVTATIGAISIGVGIDFATHMTMRMVEERKRHDTPEASLLAAVGGTGTALTGSALTSIAGFSVLALAPMPMFATYGLLTALMILFALIASLIVLPSVLLVFGDLPEATDPEPVEAEISRTREPSIPTLVEEPPFTGVRGRSREGEATAGWAVVSRGAPARRGARSGAGRRFR